MTFAPTWVAAALVVGLLAGSLGAWHVRGLSADRDLAALREDVAAGRAAAALEALKLRQAQERAIEEVQHHANQSAAAARRDAAAAADLAGRLREHITRLAAATAADSPAAGASHAASGAGLVFADVLAGADARLRALAEYADQARVAGFTCQRTYEAVRSAQ